MCLPKHTHSPGTSLPVWSHAHNTHHLRHCMPVRQMFFFFFWMTHSQEKILIIQWRLAPMASWWPRATKFPKDRFWANRVLLPGPKSQALLFLSLEVVRLSLCFSPQYSDTTAVNRHDRKTKNSWAHMFCSKPVIKSLDLTWSPNKSQEKGERGLTLNTHPAQVEFFRTDSF